MPGVEIQVGPSDAAAVLVEHVQVVAAGQGRGEELVQVEVPFGIDRLQLPAEHPPGVVGVVLRVAARAHVEEDASAAFLLQAGVGELQAELRLADAGRADHGRQRARQQPAAQQVVESVDAGGEAWSVGHGGRQGLGISSTFAFPISVQRRDNRWGLLRLMGLGVDAKAALRRCS